MQIALKSLRWLSVLCFATVAAMWAAPLSAANTLIENVSVLPMTGAGLQTDWAVLVQGDRIVAAGPRSQIAAQRAASADTKLIDGQGGVLIPGLIDMHIHLRMKRPAEQITRNLELLAAHGVTTVRIMWGENGQLSLREAIVRENRFAPSLVLAGPGFGETAKSPDEIRTIVMQQAKAGWDLIKVHWKPTADQFDAIMSAAKAAGIEASGHVPYAVSLDRALSAGLRSIEHMDGYIRDMDAEGGPASDEAIRNAVSRTRSAGAAVTPTMFGWRLYLREADLGEVSAMPDLAYVSQATVVQWKKRYEQSSADRATAWAKSLIGLRDVTSIVRNRQRLLRAFADGDVPVLFGSDAGQPFVIPGVSVVREMLEMQAAGLTNRQIIASATAAAGQHLDPDGRIGVIAPNARADLVLVAENPLDSLQTLATPQGVMLRGQWHNHTALTQAREKAAARAEPGR